MSSGEVEKEILKLDKTEASQKTDIPTRIIKENIDIFADLNSAIKSSNFSSPLKLADVTHVHKKGSKDIKEDFRPVSILLFIFFQKFLKNVCLLKCLLFSITFFRINNAVFEKDAVLNISFW